MKKYVKGCTDTKKWKSMSKGCTDKGKVKRKEKVALLRGVFLLKSGISQFLYLIALNESTYFRFTKIS